MKCQILFSGKKSKKDVNLSPAELAQRVINVKSKKTQVSSANTLSQHTKG